ncbi:MAG: hypothetical protein Q8R79_06910 [Legionellaceae bacterium]|nr:hypothetical protein [Legionellaceae bacterium]
MILKRIGSLLNTYIGVFCNHFVNKKHLSRIEHIDMERKTIVVHTRGVNAPLHLKFDAIIKEEALLNSFSSIHASYIGYCYGVHSRVLAKDTDAKGYFYCFTDNPSNKYTIRGLDRHRNVMYIDQTNKNQIIRSPVQIMALTDIIINFPPLQACYIGILAGINHSKSQKKNRPSAVN